MTLPARVFWMLIVWIGFCLFLKKAYKNPESRLEEFALNVAHISGGIAVVSTPLTIIWWIWS